MEGRAQETHPVSRRPQRPRRSDAEFGHCRAERPEIIHHRTGSNTIERADGAEDEFTTALDKKRRIDTAYEVYLGLYQAITGPEEPQKLFREFSPGFLDLIVIDECHRGIAADDAAWKDILNHFSGATQIGLTATPKETEYVSNIHYFGSPVYTYSLRQGIEDGFLAPYLQR